MISSIFIHFIHWSHQSRAPANRLNESASFWILENFIYRVDSFEFIETVVGTISGTFHWNSREITWLSWGVNWTLEYANRGLNKVVIGWLIRWFSPINRHLGSTINVNFAVERSAVIRWVVVTLTGALHCKWMNGTTLLFMTAGDVCRLSQRSTDKMIRRINSSEWWQWRRLIEFI